MTVAPCRRPTDLTSARPRPVTQLTRLAMPSVPLQVVLAVRVESANLFAERHVLNRVLSSDASALMASTDLTGSKASSRACSKE